MTIKGFVFDLDGVITDSAEYHFLAWKALAKELDIMINREFNEQLKGVSRMDSLERILKYGAKDQLYNQQEKEALAAKKNEHYVSLIKDVTKKDLLPGVSEFLTELKAKDMKLALASASKNGPFLLEGLGIKELFDTIVDPAQLTHGKPDPEIFQKGASQLGLSVEECVGIEDAPAGIEAINAAGMFSVGIGSKDSLGAADYLISSTEELALDNILVAVAHTK
ncbi:beta-phosphoglucomutase [Granulicatella balaenopterae]|uniref:Beta-phosphoglucomutase n=1 Tax=Granulicatella balaenopterae TaxID=137733 RepID=A0A1H9HQS3_9LACT|nr:beta-phosphoglucomutase [Granulicatella balaenopterae]SEQ64667.1 beta-phosphoglucomutase [Granulicatella balaenopterae]